MQFFLTMLIYAALLGATSAQAGDVYSVSNVEVEATASNAVRAREAAIIEGHSLALTRLFKRITLPKDWAKLPKIAGKDAQLLAVGYTMSKGRNSETRYIGELSVRFIPARVRSILQQKKIPFGDVQINPVLVVPVYDLPNGRRLVWENKNIWRQAWGQSHTSESLTPFILPIGDIEDIVALPAAAARAKNRAALFRLAKRYNARRVLFAHAKLYSVRWGPERGYGLGITLTVISKQGHAPDEEMIFSVSRGDTPQELAKRGVNDILRMTETAWKQRIILDLQQIGQREVQAIFTSIKDWRMLRKLLDQVSVLNNYEIRRIDNKSALLSFNYSSSRDILALALKQRNIKLTFPEDEDDLWQIELQK